MISASASAWASPRSNKAFLESAGKSPPALVLRVRGVGCVDGMEAKDGMGSLLGLRLGCSREEDDDEGDAGKVNACVEVEVDAIGPSADACGGNENPPRVGPKAGPELEVELGSSAVDFSIFLIDLGGE